MASDEATRGLGLSAPVSRRAVFDGLSLPPLAVANMDGKGSDRAGR